MNVVVNGRFQSRRITGVERYGQEMLRCLGDRLRVVRPGLLEEGGRGHAWEQFILPGKIQSNEILWSPANTGPLAISRQVLTVHDLFPLEHPEWFKPAFSSWYRLFMPILARRVRVILVPSLYVRRKMITRFSLRPEQVVAIPHGVDQGKFHPGEARDGKYVLFVGSLEPRKNLTGLLMAWEKVKDKHPDTSLVIAGTMGSVFSRMVFPLKMERVQFLGYLSDADLPTLYAKAVLFVLPSYDEGFGLPILEAMACGTPVIASNAGALPEVVGDAGLLFDPADPLEIASVMHLCLTNTGTAQILREKGLEHVRKYSWQNTAQSTWKVLQECQ